MRWIRSSTRARGESGAVAVEFALVSVFFFPMLFGMIQYGLWFNDSLNARQGVREAVRQGVVSNFTGGTGATDMEKLKNTTKNQIGAITGTAYVKVVRPSPWMKGSPLTICTLVKSAGGIGLLPMPNSGWIQSKTQMSIEQDVPLPTGTTANGTDTLPSPASWATWCAG